MPLLIFIYTYVCVHTHTYVHTHTCIRARMHAGPTSASQRHSLCMGALHSGDGSAPLYGAVRPPLGARVAVAPFSQRGVLLRQGSLPVDAPPCRRPRRAAGAAPQGALRCRPKWPLSQGVRFSGTSSRPLTCENAVLGHVSGGFLPEGVASVARMADALGVSKKQAPQPSKTRAGAQDRN